jgi:hypothetical protein
MKFQDVKVGEEFKDKHGAIYLKIEHHDYDLGYYQINAVSLDVYELDYFKDNEDVTT